MFYHPTQNKIWIKKNRQDLDTLYIYFCYLAEKNQNKPMMNISELQFKEFISKYNRKQ